MSQGSIPGALSGDDGVNRSRLFFGCIISLVATALGFAVRASILDEWGTQFNLTQLEKGVIQGAGLMPFAITIILFSLIVDRIGYGKAMIFAFVFHVSSALITICAPLMLGFEGGQRWGYILLYTGTFIYALGNGVVEAVINPVTATLFDKKKTHYLNILHAGWPGGLVLGGLLAYALGDLSWEWKITLVLLPTLAYGFILYRQNFPVQERVAAGASYMDMLREFGALSCLIVCYLMVAGVNQVLDVATDGRVIISPGYQLLIALVPTAVFAVVVRSLGRPMFVFLLLVMFLLATTELGTDSWIVNIMGSVLDNPQLGTLFLVWTASIMFVLRFFAGPIVHRISPLGLLAVCSAIASLGLIWLSAADTAVMLFVAATFYGFGKTFFWPTTLGVISEQYPKGGALMLNAIAGVGMISVGTLGNPLIGYFQDKKFDEVMEEKNETIHEKIVKEQRGVFGMYNTLDQEKKAELSTSDQKIVDEVVVQSQQGALARIAVLPAVMLLCYLGLIFYFRAQGGYKAEVLIGHAADDEEMTGGVPGPVE